MRNGVFANTELQSFGITYTTFDTMKVRSLAESAMFFWLHSLGNIISSNSSSHVTGVY